MEMDKTKEMNTICAISTPYGSGGIAVIRVSGEDAIAIVNTLFRGRKSLAEAAAYTVHYVEIVKGENGKVKGEGVVAVPMAIATDMETGEELMLTLGTRLPNYAHGTFEVLNKKYLIDPNCVNCLEDASLQLRGEEICATAQTLLNAPYLWGGKNAMGMDCSGFTQVVYSVFGINLLRNAREQITQGTPVASLAEAQPGDLAFFDHADRDPKATNISHVGLLLDNKTIIHCSGCVHVDYIDDMGIHLPDGELTHHLVQIKRYL